MKKEKDTFVITFLIETVTLESLFKHEP
jgi:hypothetical protein